jgi:hypothetical protein
VPKPGERGIGAAHAFLFQEPEQVAADVNAFFASPTTASSVSVDMS